MSDEREILKLEHLIALEAPELTRRTIKVKAVIASNTVSYNVPLELQETCTAATAGEDHDCEGSATLIIEERDMPAFVDIVDTRRENKCSELAAKDNNFTDKCHLEVSEKKHTTLKRLRVRPIVEALEVQDGKVTDSYGNEYKHYDIYLMQNKVKEFEPGKQVELTGLVIPDPKTQKITLIARDAHVSEDEQIDMAKLRELHTMFSDRTTEDSIDWIVAEFQKFSKITKRYNVAAATLLAFFSPYRFEFDGKVIPGWSKIAIDGDSTTAKSETVKQMIRLLRAGQIVSAETASVAGLAAAATQTSSNQWFVEYGPLVLQDKKLLAIDGAHKLSAEQWASLAEAQRSGVIKLTKAAKGEAHARTRQILIMNPIGQDRRTTRTVNSFFYPVQVLTSNLDVVTIARIDLAVFVKAEDVSAEDVNREMKETEDQRLHRLSELVKLIWQQKFDFHFDQDALEQVFCEATRLYNKFRCAEIPLMSIDMKYKLARLSIACAALTCSFNDDFSVLTIKKEHVEYVSKFLETEYHSAGLDIISEKTHNGEIDSETATEIVNKVKDALKDRIPVVDDNFCRDLLVWIAEQTSSFTREQLRYKFSLADKHELRPLLALLQTEGLLEQVKGFRPTSHAIKLGKYFANLANFANVKKSILPIPVSSNDVGGDISHDYGKHGNDGKESPSEHELWEYTGHTTEGGNTT